MGNTISSSRSQAKGTQPGSFDIKLSKKENKSDPKVNEVKNASLPSLDLPGKIPPETKIKKLDAQLQNAIHPDLIYEKARCLIVELDKFVEGLEECRKLLDYGADCNVYILTAMAHLGLGQVEKGEQTIGILRGMQLDKEQESIIKLMEADIALQKKEYGKALSLAEQVREETASLASESIILQAKVHNAQNNEELEYECLNALRSVKNSETAFVFKGILRAGELHAKKNEIMKAGLCFLAVSYSKTFPFSWTDKMHSEPLALCIMQEAKQLMQKQRYKEASAHLLHAFYILPNATWPYLLLLECMAHLKIKTSLAKPAYTDMCLKEFPENPWLNLVKADALFKEGLRADAWACYQKFLKKFPDSPFIFEDRFLEFFDSLCLAYLEGEVQFDKAVIEKCLNKLQTMSGEQDPMMVKVGMYACSVILYGANQNRLRKVWNEIEALQTKDYRCVLQSIFAISLLRDHQMEASHSIISRMVEADLSLTRPLTDVAGRTTDEIVCILAWIESSLYRKKMRPVFWTIAGRIAKENPRNGYAKFINAILLFYEKNKKESLAALDGLLASYPSASFSGAAYYYKAIQHPEEDIETRAMLGKKALDLGYIKGVIPYTVGLAKEERYKEAAGLLEKHAAIVEENLTPALINTLSIVFIKVGNFKKPIDLCLKAIAAKPDAAELAEYNNLLSGLAEMQPFLNICEEMQNAANVANSAATNKRQQDKSYHELDKSFTLIKNSLSELPGMKEESNYPELMRGIDQIKTVLTDATKAKKENVRPDKREGRTPEQKKKKKKAHIDRESKQQTQERKDLSYSLEPTEAIILSPPEPDAKYLEAMENNREKEERIKADLARAEKKRDHGLVKEKGKGAERHAAGKAGLEEIEQTIAEMPSRERFWFSDKMIAKNQNPPVALPPLFVKTGHPHNFLENDAKKRCIDLMRKESSKLLRWVDPCSKAYLEALAELKACEGKAGDQDQSNHVLSAVPYKKQPLKSASDAKGKTRISPAVLNENDQFIITSAKLACVSLNDTLDRSSQTGLFNGDSKEKKIQVENSLLYNLLKLFHFLNAPDLGPELARSLHQSFLDKDTINRARNDLRHNFFALGGPKIKQLAQTLTEGKAKELLDGLSKQQAEFQGGLDIQVLRLLPAKEEIINKGQKDYLKYFNDSLNEFCCLAEPFRKKLNMTITILEQDSDSLHALKMTVAKMCDCLRQLRVEKKGILAFIVKLGNRVAHEKGDNPFGFEDINTSNVWKLIEQMDSIKEAASGLAVAEPKNEHTRKV